MSTINTNQRESMGSRQKCAWCAGRGQWAVAVGYVISCPVCGGKGQVLVTQPAGTCRQCQGSGRRDATGPCLTCAGTGWARVFGQ